MTRDVLIARWQEIGGKMTELAAEFPAECYTYRPAPSARSFAEQLRHVAFWNEYAAATMRGGQPDGSANELPEAAYATNVVYYRLNGLVPPASRQEG